MYEEKNNEIAALHRRCGIYTKTAIVRRILDAVGWKSTSDLSQARLLEPAAGNGQFIVEAARRLVESFRHHRLRLSHASLSDRIQAFELHPGETEKARARVYNTLRELRVHHHTAAACSNAWIENTDFLLTPPCHTGFTHIVGNPPYIRWSKIPVNIRSTYSRLLHPEMTGGDLFLPILDHALEQLLPKGHCGFICSDRWRFMQFARSFRRKWLPALEIISEVPIPAEEAFLSVVNAYATILVASKRTKSFYPSLTPSTRNTRTLAEMGHFVRVGPALGHNPAFVLEPNEHDVEQELLCPWLDTSEIQERNITWRGRHVIAINNDDGTLIKIQKYPLLTARLKRYKSILEQRSIVRNGAPWYRTIDRVSSNIWSRPKLLVPELAKVPRLAIDRSGAVPSHGVYAIFAHGDDVDGLYERFCDGQLARYLEPISPRVKGGYLRCYKRFLSAIRLPI